MSFPQPRITPGPSLRGRLGWVVVWALVAAIFVWLGSQIAWRIVLEALSRADPAWICLAIAVNFAGLPFWAAAIKLFVPEREPRSYPRILEVMALTTTATQCVSIFAGGATAAWLLVRRVGMSTGAMLGVITIEQLTSGIVKCVFLSLAFLFSSAPSHMISAAAVLLLAVSAALAFLVWTAHASAIIFRLSRKLSGWRARLVAWLAEWTSHLEALRDPVRYAGAILFVIGRRATEVLAILCVQEALGFPVSIETGLLVEAAILLATSIPGPPGNLGLYEAAVVVAYGWRGVDAETAVALALLQHAAYLFAAIVPGLLVLAVNRRGRLAS